MFVGTVRKEKLINLTYFMKQSLLALVLVVSSTFQINAQVSVTLSPSQNAAIGFHTGFNTANNNYNTATQMAAYTIPGSSSGINVNRSLIQFDLSQIPVGATITSAKLSLYKIPSAGILSGHTVGNNQSYLRLNTQAWNQTTVTWNNAPATTTTNQVLMDAATSSNQDFLNVDMANVIQFLVNNPSQNHGFLFGLVEETPTRVLIFCSNYFSDVNKRPKLEVTYCVTPTLTVSANGNTTFCEGGSVALSVNANSSFVWNDGGSENPRNVNQSGVYSVSSTNGCAATSNLVEVNVNENPAVPTITPSGSVNITQGSSVTLQASSANAYEWLPNGQTSQSISVNQSGSYSVRAFNAAGCSALSAPTVVTVSPVVEPPVPTGCSAVEVMDYNPAKRNDGTFLPAERTISSRVLGAAQNSDATTSEANVNFASLGFGGSITVRMSGPIANGPGDDIKVFETTFGSMSGNCVRYPETVRAFASQDNCNWVYLGDGCQDATFDLKELDWAAYIRLVDVSPISSPYENQTADGYDVDGIECLNGYRENPVAQDLGASYAMSVESVSQGLRKNGTPVAASRSIAANALGAPQNTNTVNFISLGFGGSIVLKLGYVVFDKVGDDIQVVETSYGNPTCAAYGEKALVEVSLDGNSWTELGQLCLDGTVNLEVGGIGAAQYVRITDRSAASSFSGAGDGYDLDGVVVLQPGCSSTNPEAKIVDDVWTKDELAQITVKQNITKDAILVQIPENASSQSVIMNVYSMTGQLVQSNAFNIPANQAISQMLDLSALKNGIYLIAVQGIDGVENFKVVKQ